MQPTMRDSFVAANLIEAVDLNDPDKMERNISTLVRMVVQDIFAIQPVTLRRLDDYIVMSRKIFKGILLWNKLPISELPPCILTKTLDSKSKEMTTF